MAEELDTQQLAGKNWMATMMSCWALGSLGAHRFYTGKTTSAWIMFVMTIIGFLAPITCIWALMGGFMIALGKFKAADGEELYERIDWVGYIYVAIMILSILAGIGFVFLMGAAMAAAIAGTGAMPPVAP